MQNGFDVKRIYQLTYIYLAIPLFIFFMSWLDYAFAIGFTLIFALGFYKLYGDCSKTKSEIRISNNVLLSAIAIAVVWCFFAGIGYFYYQSFDYHFRNAVFRDLINYPWPVFYNQANTPLVYYMGFWLLPAALAKLISIGGNSYVAFLVGNIYLFIYAAFGVTLLLLHLSVAVQAKQLKKFLLAALIFIFFSGMDIIGYKFFLLVNQPFEYHMDWWATFIQYSSITTSMFWVFNQFIPTALMILLIYNERQIMTFGFMIPLILFLAPYPTFGIGVFMVSYAFYTFCKSSEKLNFIKNEIFSIPNMIGVFWCLPAVILYFITNSEGMDRWHYIFLYTTPQRLLLFMVLEFLLVAFVLLLRYRKDVFFITAFVSLLFIPFLRLDQQNNFCMRASQPALILFAIFSIRFLFENYKEKKHKIASGLLVILLFIGSATPLMEFYRGLHYTFEAGKLALVQDSMRTLNKRLVIMPLFGWDANHQYTARNYQTDIFWRYLAHRHIPDAPIKSK